METTQLQTCTRKQWLATMSLVEHDNIKIIEGYQMVLTQGIGLDGKVIAQSFYQKGIPATYQILVGG